MFSIYNNMILLHLEVFSINIVNCIIDIIKFNKLLNIRENNNFFETLVSNIYKKTKVYTEY